MQDQGHWAKDVNASPGHLRRTDRRDAAMTRQAIRIVLIIDHPAQQFARALQLLAAEPGLQVRVCYWSTPERSYDPDFARRSRGTSTCSGDIPGRRPDLPDSDRAGALAGPATPQDAAGRGGLLRLGGTDLTRGDHVLPAGSHAANHVRGYHVAALVQRTAPHR